MSWSNELIIDFIELYKKEKILWDYKHPCHKNRKEITSAWMRIQSSMSALNLNCTITDLKKKKESLMTSFRFHISKRKLNPDYDTSWFAFKYMDSFLGDRYNHNVPDPLEDEFLDHSEYNNRQAEVITDTDPISGHGHNKTDINSESIIGLNQKRYKLRKTGIKHYRDQADDVTTTITSRETSNHDSYDLDEYELYGKLLAKKLRKLDEHQRDIAMHEIDNIMFRVKMNGATERRTYSTTSSPIPPKMKSPIFIVAQSNNSNSQFENENICYQE